MGDILTTSTLVLLLLLLLCSFNKIDGFTTITPTVGGLIVVSTNLRNSIQSSPSNVHKNALVTYATIPKVSEQISIITTTTTIPSNDTTIQMGWDCNDEVECTEVPLCTAQECRTSLDVRYHNVWYDVSGWRSKHPAGSHWIDYYDGRDATEVLDGFHTIKGQSMIQRLPKSKVAVTEMLSQTVPDDTMTQLNFRALKKDLETKGYWERNLVHEYTQLGIWATLVISAAVLSHLPVSTVMTMGSNGGSSGILSVLSSFLLALSMTAAGWLGHDYIHGIDTFAYKFRNFAAVAAGLAPIWWSDKHNKHHALTNEMGVDEDIATDPFLYSWAPDPSEDSPLRKIQHYIFFIPFSAMFALWRIDSVKVAIEAVEKKRPDAKKELYALLIHYAILFTVFPIAVWLPAIFVSGLMSALIVTPTHQSESKFEEYQPDWVTAQFQSTRNAVTTNPFSEWLWGGMQYQLEHHLFPSMPRNKYPQLRSILQQFAKDNKIPGGYRETDEFQILKMNWQLYKDVAEADPVPGAPSTRGRPGQIGAIRDSGSPAMALPLSK